MNKACPHCGFSLTQAYGHLVCNICGWWTMEDLAAILSSPPELTTSHM